MANLIDRDDAVQMLREKAKGYFVSMFGTSGECHIARVVTTECAAEINNMPTVEIVRCGECIHRRKPLYPHPTMIWCPLVEHHHHPDWFCAYGRREKE